MSKSGSPPWETVSGGTIVRVGKSGARGTVRKRSRALNTTLSDLARAPEKHDFLDLCRKLEAELLDKPRIGDSLTRREDIAGFGQDPYFAFATSNISRSQVAADGIPTIFVRFLGLLGPQGAMPLGLTEEAFRFLREDDDGLARFIDVLNNRFIQLFFRAWASSRPLTHRDRPAEEDRFAAYVGSQIGLGSSTFRGQDSVDDLVKIAYAGLLGAKTKSASRLRAMLSKLFGVKVEVEEFVGMRLLFEPEQRSRIGEGFATLGRDVLLGAGVYSVQDKIRFRIYASSLTEFESFLPVGAKARAFADMVAFYLGLELQWDVELLLPASQAQGMTLGTSGRLGWTSWVAPNWTIENAAFRGDARFDLMQRFKPTSQQPRH